jgi:hypothetical protein
MAKRSPRRQPQTTEPASTPEPAPAKQKVPPPSVKKQPLPPDAEKRARQYYKDHAEILGSIWRMIYG